MTTWYTEKYGPADTKARWHGQLPNFAAVRAMIMEVRQLRTGEIIRVKLWVSARPDSAARQRGADGLVPCALRSRQFGRASAPIIPQPVNTLRGPNVGHRNVVRPRVDAGSSWNWYPRFVVYGCPLKLKEIFSNRP
jgi:hypothetical protein